MRNHTAQTNTKQSALDQFALTYEYDIVWSDVKKR